MTSFKQEQDIHGTAVRETSGAGRRARRAPAVFRRALAAGGTAPAAVNAANEQAVAMFLAGELSFLDISRRAERILDRAWPRAAGIEDVLAADREARRITKG